MSRVKQSFLRFAKTTRLSFICGQVGYPFSKVFRCTGVLLSWFVVGEKKKYIYICIYIFLLTYVSVSRTMSLCEAYFRLLLEEVVYLYILNIYDRKARGCGCIACLLLKESPVSSVKEFRYQIQVYRRYTLSRRLYTAIECKCRRDKSHLYRDQGGESRSRLRTIVFFLFLMK